jgi:hypothetical protein
MAGVSLTLARIRQDVGQFLPEPAIVSACQAAGHRWRERKLGPVQTTHLFILQVVCFNAAITHLRHLAGHSLNAAAYCRARMRLPLAALQQLLRDSSTTLRQTLSPGSDPRGWWCGLRAFLLDGSSTITPDTAALQKAFGQPKGQKKGCGFPVPKLLGLFDAFTGMVVEMLGFPLYTHEQSKVWQLHPLLGAGDLVVADCGFCSFVHLAMLSARGVAACFRCHQRQIVDFRPHRKSRDKAAKGHKTGKPTSTFVRRLGPPRPDRAMETPRIPAPVDQRPAVGGDARVVGCSRIAIHPGRQRPADADGDDRDDAAGPGHISQREDRRIVRHAVAGGDALRTAQDDAEDAQDQEPDRGRRPQGTGDLLPGL